MKIYIKIAYTTILGYIDIDNVNTVINDNTIIINETIIELLKQKAIHELPILGTKQFELVESCQDDGEEAEPLIYNNIIKIPALYIRILDNIDCNICFMPFNKQQPRLLNHNCGHECCKNCFHQLSTCHICRGPMSLS